MGWLLNLVYLALIALASPWLLWRAVRQGKYRAGFAEKLLGQVPLRSGHRPCLWIHAVSVGEVNLIQSLLGQLEQDHPGWDVVISTTTLTGYALANKRYAPRLVIFAPLDFTWAVNAALRRIRPDVLVLMELELWPNLLRTAKRRGVKLALLNGRLGDNSFRGYSRCAWLWRPLLAQFDLVAVQTPEYAARFQALGCPAERTFVTGSLKFDGAVSDRANEHTARLARLVGISPRTPIMLAGSTQSHEEAVALAAFKQVVPEFPELKLILVPRHPERFEEVALLLERTGLPWLKRSSLTKPVEKSAWQVLLVDAVGELGAWWGTANIAFVGGSLGNRGGQNMIEPAAYGAAVCFGPNTWNFRDVVERFLAAEAAVVVHDSAELAEFMGRCLRDPEYAAALGERGGFLVRAQQGAALRTLELLKPLLSIGDQAPTVATTHLSRLAS